MKFFEPTEKRNTIAAYAFFVALFIVICIMIGINIALFGQAWTFIINVLKPILYGLVIAFLMRPIVRFIETKILGNRKEKKIGFRHFISVIIAYVVVITLIILFCMTAIPQIIDTYDIFVDKFLSFIDEFRNDTAEFVNSRSSRESVYIYYGVGPEYQKDVTENLFSVTLRSFDGTFYGARSSSGIQEVKDIFDEALTSIGNTIKSSLPDLFSSALTLLMEAKNLILGIFFSLYVLLGERKHAKRIDFVCKAWLPKKLYSRLKWLFKKCASIFRDYVTVRLLDSLIIGILTFVCLFIFQIPHDFELLLAVIMGLSSFFPYIGTLIGMTVGTLILLIFDFKYAVLYLVISIVISFLDSRYIEPLLSLDRAEHTLPPIWVFTAIVFMGGLFGVIGILIGIPTFSLGYSIIKEISGKRLRALSLSDDTRDYFVIESGNGDKINDDVIDMRDYYDERRETENEIADNARKQFSKLTHIFKRSKNDSDSNETPSEDNDK